MSFVLFPKQGASKADLAAVTPQQPGGVIIGGANGPITSRAGLLDPRLGGTRLRNFHAALAKRNTAPVNIVALGDSITEGSHTSTMGKRWIEVMRDKLRANWQPAGITGGAGYYAAKNNVPSDSGGPWTLTGGSADASYRFGLGRKAWQLTTSGDQASITITGSSFDLLYTVGTAYGSFSVTIDGGSATVVATGGSVHSGAAWHSGALTPGSHSVVVAWSSGGIVSLEGIMIHNGDETAGIRVWEGGYAGADSSWLFGGYWSTTIGTIQPQAVIIEFGSNDWRKNKPSATLKTNLQTLITQVRGQCTVPPAIVLMTVPQSGDTPVPYPSEPWQNYLDALWQVAVADPDVALFDAGARFPSSAWGAGINLIFTDMIHPNDDGDELIASALAAFLAP